MFRQQEDHIYTDMIEKSTMQWLEQVQESGDVVNKHGAKLAVTYIEILNKKIKELESKNALKDEFLKKLKGQLRVAQEK